MLLVGGLALDQAQAAEVTAGNPEALNRAIKAARPGDTILMADGTWRDVEIDFLAARAIAGSGPVLN